MLRILRLVNTQVIQEECKVTSTDFLSDLVDECNKNFCVDGFRMHDLINEPCSSLMAAITAKVVTLNSESLMRILSLLCAHPFDLKVLNVNIVSSR